MRSIKQNMILNIIKQSSSIIFPLITFPYISRIFGAEIYGKVNFGNSIISYISLIAMFGISNYAIREGSVYKYESSKFNKFANEIFSLNILATIIAYILFFILLLSWSKMNNYIPLILVQALVVIFSPLSVDWLFTIEEDFAYITFRSVFFNLVSLVLILIAVKSPSDYLLYAFIMVASTGCSSMMNFHRAHKYINLRYTFTHDLTKHLVPLVILFASAVTTTIYVSSDLTMLGILRSDYDVGIYSVSSKLYTIVKYIINAALVVCVPRISYHIGKNNFQELNNLLNKSLESIVMIVFPTSIGLFCLGDKLVILLAGQSYSESGYPTKILGIALIFALFASFETTQILIPYKKDSQVFIAVLLSAVVNIMLNIFLIPKYGAVATAFSTLISEFVVFIITIIPVYKVFKPTITVRYITYCIGSLLIYLTCEVIKYTITNNLLVIILSILLSLIVYSCMLFFTKNEIFISIFRRSKHE